MISKKDPPAGSALVGRINPERKAGEFISSRGFALVVALTLMAFIVLISLSFMGALRLESRGTSTLNHQEIARKNALLGMNIALSTIQAQAGPDRSITAWADINPEAADATRFWTGVWDSSESRLVTIEGGRQVKPGAGSFRRWLVSLADSNGNPDAAGAANETIITENPFPGGPFSPVRLVNDSSTTGVQAGRIAVPGASGQSEGTFAWWAGDESLKARINLRDPRAGAALGSTDWNNRWRSPPQFGVSALANPGGGTIPPAADLDRLIWADSLGLVDANLSGVSRSQFHDLTTHSRGLAIDVRAGRLRRDLTAAFENNAVFDAVFPANSKLFEFREDPALDSFLDSFVYNYNGPNWGILRSHYQKYRPNTWEDLAGGLNMKSPVLWRSDADPAQRPYEIQSGNLLTGNGVYQQNSPLHPVLARLQLSFRISFYDLESHGVPPEDMGDGKRRFFKKPMIHVTPTLVLYNPYNIYLRVLQQRIEITNNPLIELRIGGREPVEFYLNEIMAPNFSGSAGHISGFRIRTTVSDIILQPGESLIFGLDEAGYLFANPATHVFGNRWYLNNPRRLEMKNDNEIQFSFQLPTNADYIIEARDDGADDRVAFQAESGPRPVFPATGFSPEFPSFGLSRAERERLRIAEVFDADGAFVPEESEVEVEVRISFSNFASNWHITQDGEGNRISTQRFQNDMGLKRDGMEPQGSTSFELFQNYTQLESRSSLATWRYGLRTINENADNAVRFIDANFRAINLLPQVSGGWEENSLAADLPMSNFGAPFGRLDSNALTEMPGDWDASIQRYRAFWGADIEGVSGGIDNRTNVVLFDIPREPLLSIGALKHANVGRYGFHPNYIVGQSYAPPLVRRDQAWRQFGFIRPGGGRLNAIYLDLPYILNAQLWDSYFFSSIPPDLAGANLTDLMTGESHLPNSRHRLLYSPNPSVEDIRYNGSNPRRAFESAAGRLVIEGAFNINSTSTAAWRALLSSSNAFELPVFDPRNRSNSPGFINNSEGPLFPRLTRNYGDVDDLFAGARRLSPSQVEALAEVIVDEVRARGPFGSLGDFVNRSLGNPREPRHQESGALQAAIDRTSINQRATDLSGPTPLNTYGSSYDETPSGPQATGLAGYLLQSDILQLLGPVLTARSDTFIVRSYGEKRDPATNQVQAKAWCEVVLQRIPEPLDFTPAWSEDLKQQELIQPSGDFGRRFQVVAFRWLHENEI